MEQLALVEKDPAPIPQPLTAEEIAEEERLDAAADAELAEQKRREEENLAESRRKREEEYAAEVAAADASGAGILPAGESLPTVESLPAMETDSRQAGSLPHADAPLHNLKL